MSKQITVSDDLYNELLEIKNAIKKERQKLREWECETEEIDAECPQATFDGAIRKIIVERNTFENDAEELKFQHCVNCCDCEHCTEIRKGWAEEEAEKRFWENVEEH